MKIHELLWEQKSPSAQAEALLGLLIPLHASNMKTIQVDQLARSLLDQKMNVSKTWILNTSKQFPIVDAEASNMNRIVLKLRDEQADDASDDENTVAQPTDSEKTVEKMARDALTKRIK